MKLRARSAGRATGFLAAISVVVALSADRPGWADGRIARGSSSACQFDSAAGSLNVDGAGLGAITVGRSAAAPNAEIQVRFYIENPNPQFPGGSGTLSCADPSQPGTRPAIDTVDTITVQGTYGLVLDLSQGELAPGKTTENESGSPEIEIGFSPPQETKIQSAGITFETSSGEGSGPTALDWRFGSIAGSQGANLNAAEEATSGPDVDVTSPPVSVAVEGTDGDDRIDGKGGDTFDGPLQRRLAAIGGGGDDILLAGEGRGVLEGDDGDDLLVGSDTRGDLLVDGRGNDIARGLAGDDIFEADRGDDKLLAGDGDRDELSTIGGPGGVKIDLRKTGPQNAASLGTDAFRGFEQVRGSPFRDVLIGDAGPNLLMDNNSGDDRLVGNGGADRLFGVYGDDELIGGPGADRLFGSNNDDILHGGEGADRLNASGGDDRVTGGSGRDILLGGANRDVLLARDGIADRRIDCGTYRNHEVVRRDPQDPSPIGC